MAIVCARCGQQNPDGAQFCVNQGCGEYLSWEGALPQPGPVQATEPRSVPLAQTTGGYLELNATELVAEPGASARITATVYNRGSQVEEFTMTAVGAAAAWVTFEPSTLQVYPGTTAECTVRFAPPRQGTTPAGRTRFTVRATSTLHPGMLVSADGTAEIGIFRELTATLIPQHASARGITIHNIELTNTGNAIEQVRVRATDPSARIRFGLPADEVAVAPGSQVVPMTVWPPRRRFGRPQRHTFQVTISPPAPSVPLRLDGSREMRPSISRLTMVLVLLGLMVACLGVCTFNALR